MMSNAPALPQDPRRAISAETKEVAGGRLASLAQPPRVTSVFLPWRLSLRRTQPIPSTSFLDNPGALLEGLRCFTAFPSLPRTTGFHQAFRAVQLTNPTSIPSTTANV